MSNRWRVAPLILALVVGLIAAGAQVSFGAAPPVAFGQSLSTAQNTALLITLAASDPDSPSQTLSIVTPPARGTLSPLSPPVCVPINNGAGGGGIGDRPAGPTEGNRPPTDTNKLPTGSNCSATVTYTPTPGLSGPDGFTFRSNDGGLNSNTATVAINVTPVAQPPAGGPGGPGDTGGCTPAGTLPGDLPRSGAGRDGTCIAAPKPPVAVAQNLSTGQNAARGISLQATDADSAALTFSIVTPPAHGTLSALSPANCVPAGLGTSCTAALFYTPNPGYTGPDVFTFRAGDGVLISNTAAVNIVVTANAAPQAFGGGVFTTPGTPKQIPLLGTDTDSAALTFQVATPPTKGTLVLGAPACTPAGAGTNCTAIATYTPGAGQTGADSFSYKVNDGVSDSNFATYNVTITPTPPANTAPTAQNLNIVASRNSSQAVQLAATDPDSPALSFSIVTPPANGTLVFVTPARTRPPGLPQGLSVARASLNCTPNGAGTACTQDAVYTPNPGYSGPDSFSYKANDGVSDSNTATGNIQVVVPPNAPPAATAQTQTVGFNQPKALTLAGSDTDSASLTFSIVSSPSKGTLGPLGAPSCLPAGAGTNCTSTVTYTPNAGQTGPDSFTFKVNDGTSDSTVVTVTLNISNAPIGAAPTATPQSVGVALNTPKPITLAAADTDSATLAMSIVTPPAHGTLTPLSAPVCVPAGPGSNCTATTTYTPNAGYNGPDSFTFKANDGTSDSNIASVTIAVAADLPPVVTTSAGNTTFTEGGAAVVVDALLTVTDADHANLASATVTITNILNPGVEVLAANTGGTPITQAYNPATGVLTLTGPATVAQFQQVMRTVTYRNTASPINVTTRVVRFVANDGVLPSNNGDKNVAINPLNAPVVTTSAGDTAFTESGGAVVVDNALTVTDLDSPNLASAQVVVQNGCQPGEDVIGVTPPPGITANYTAATCTLTLTGSQPVLLYQNTLRTVTYNNTSQSPNLTTRLLRFTANDGTLASNNGDKNVTITAVNQAPVLTTSAGTTAFTEAGPAVAIDNALTLTDVDSANMASATVQITTNCQSGEDVLGFTNQLGITGNYVAAGCTLTLTGSATVANYQAALRNVTYFNNSLNPNTTNRVVSFTANDGAAPSNTGTKTVSVAGVNNPPVITLGLGLPNFTEGGGAVVVDGGLTVTDADNANLASGTVSITNVQDAGVEVLNATNCAGLGLAGTGTATLTLANAGTLAAYQACLQSVTYDNTSLSPNTTPRNIRFVVNDGTVNSANADKALTVNGVNDPPIVTVSAGQTPFVENGPAVVVDNAITVTDADSANLVSGTVTITNPQDGAGEVLAETACGALGITATPGLNSLALSGNASVANYQTCLRSVTYNNTSDAPNTTDRIVSFVVNDGTSGSVPSNKGVTVAATNDPPVLANPGAPFTYSEGDAAMPISPTITVTDADSAGLASATITISANYAAGEDLLAFSNGGGMGNIAGLSNVGGVLTLTSAGSTASPAEWQAALRAVTYGNSSANPSTLTRTISFQVNDGAGVNNLSNIVARDISITSVNSAPVLANPGAPFTYNENDAPTSISTTLTVTDTDSPGLASATVTISANYNAAEDVLAFTNAAGMGNVAVQSNAGGVLTLTSAGSTATPAEWQAALRAVTYENSNAVSPSTLTRTVSFQVNDGAALNNLSNTVTRDINVATVNDAPVLATPGAIFSFTEGDPATPISTTLTVTDVDSAGLASATVTISANFNAGQDVLAFTNAAGMGNVAVQSNAGGVLTLTSAGSTATPAEWQNALRAVTYQNTSNAPTTLTRTVSFQVNDGAGVNNLSNIVTRDINIIAVNSAPVLANGGAALTYTENDAATPISTTLTVTDVDSPGLASATVTISANYVSTEDVLAFTNGAGMGNVAVQSNAGGVLTLTSAGSTATPAQWQTALRAVTYFNSSENPSATTRTVQFQVNDGAALSNLSNIEPRNINVVPVNDPPNANNDLFNGANSALGNVTLAVSTTPSTPNVAITGSVLTFGTADTDAETPGALTATVASPNTTNGGIVTMNTNGSFTYTPPPGFLGSDSFTYTLHDNDPGGDATDTATVTINVAGPLVWFVQPGGSAGNGTSLSPFATLAPLTTGGGSDALDGSGDYIFSYSGAAATAGFVLEASQRLFGQPQGLSLTDSLSRVHNLVTAGGTNPTITNGAGSGVTLASGVNIQAVTVQNSSGDGVTGSTITTATIGSNVTIQSNGGIEFNLTTAAGGTIDVGATITNGSAGTAVQVQDRSSGAVNFTGNVTSTDGPGVNLSSNTGATISFSGGLSISSSSNTAFSATGGGTLSVIAGATRALTSTSGTTLNLNGVGGTLTLTDLDKNGTGTGISLTNVSTAVTIPTGATIAATSTAAVTIDQGTGAFSYAGTINNASGRTVQVTNRNGSSPGLVQFTGSVTSTGGTGVHLDNNDTGTVTFSGGLVLSTGANPAFNASGGGTVNVCATQGCSGAGVVNTLTTTTATALNVASTNIGASGLTFRSISSNGGTATGIILDTTGSAGGLTVTGTGTAGTGGTIANKTGADGALTTGNGIYLNSTTNARFNGLQLNDFQNSAIRGFAVNGFSLQNSIIGGAVGNATGPIEGAIAFGDILAVGTAGLTGNSLINNVNVSGSIEHQLEFYNQTGTMHLTVSNSNIHDGGVDGIQTEIRGTAQAFIDINTNQISNMGSQGIQLSALETSTMHATIRNNTVTRGTQGNEGILVQNGGSADVRTAITNNTVSGFGGVAIFVGQVAGQGDAASLLEAIISDNTVTSPVTATNHAILAFVSSLTGQVSQARFQIDDNDVTYNSAAARAILIDAPDSGRTPNFYATVTDNTVTATDINAVTMISVAARNGATGHSDIRGNDVNFTGGASADGLNVREASPGTNELARGISASNDAATVLAANNPLSTTAVLPSSGDIPVVENATILLPAAPTLPTLPP